MNETDEVEKKAKESEEDEVKDLTKRSEEDRNKTYQFVELIASGSYGSVFKVHRGGKSFAIKQFHLETSRSVGGLHIKEADFLSRCDHVNIIKVIEITYGLPYHFSGGSTFNPDKKTPDQIFIIMPLAEGSCHEFLRDEVFQVPQLKRLMVQITMAVQYLHVNGIGYRDLKSSNILVFKDREYTDAYNAVLCDMGMSKEFVPATSNSEHVGTSSYKAPELLLESRAYGKEVDIWALGVIFFNFFNIEYPFDSSTEKEPKNDVVRRSNMIKKQFIRRGLPSRSVFNKLSGGGNAIVKYEDLKEWQPQSMSTFFNQRPRLAEDEESDQSKVSGQILGKTSRKVSGQALGQALGQIKGQASSDTHLSESTPNSRPEPGHLDRFEELSAALPNFGSLEEYTDLLDRMLIIDPSKRLTIDEVCNHPFFSSVPKTSGEISEIWRGLRMVKSEASPYHVLTKTSDKVSRDAGISIFKTVNTTYSKRAWRVLFLGLDIYDRVLLCLEAKVPNYDRIKDFKLLAQTCVYIAAKYLLDDSIPDYGVIFPKNRFTRSDLVITEQLVLMSFLKWKIGRVTVYDLLPKKAKADVLLNLLSKNDNVYGYKIDKIAHIFITTIQEK
jgi:serine/threonine protein kinase